MSYINFNSMLGNFKITERKNVKPKRLVLGRTRLSPINKRRELIRSKNNLSNLATELLIKKSCNEK